MPWDPNVPGSTAQADNAVPARPAANTVPSAARTATGNSGAIVVNGAERAHFLLEVTAVSGTTPSMALTVEWSHDGTTWFPAATPDTLGAAVTAAVKRVHSLEVKAPFCRIVWTITGTTPSFTFAIHAHLQDTA